MRKLNVDMEEFKKLHDNGMTDKEIANNLGFSQATARNIRCKLGLSPLISGHTAVAVIIDHEELKKLFEKGLNDKEIGKFFGVSDDIIFKHRQSLGLLRWKKWEKTVDNIEKFKQLYSEGLSDRKIGNALGICIDTARKIRHDLGLPPQPLSRRYVNTEELKRYLTIGLTDKEIGAIFGVSAHTIYERRRDVGLFRRQKQTWFENINMDDFKKLYTEGMSDVRIAEALGVQNSALIREIRHHFGLAPNQGRNNEKKRELYNAGMSDRQIAKIIKGKKKSVAAWRRNHGLPPNKSDSALNVVFEAKLLNINENETIQPNETIQSNSESSIYDPGTIENFAGKEIKKNTTVLTSTTEKTNNDILKQLFTKGFSDIQIAKYFDVSERTISNRRRNLGLYRQKPRQIRRKNIDIEEFKHLYLKGMNDVEIGRTIGISQSAVFRIRHHLGLASNSGKRHWKMRELYDLKLSDSKIAKTLKVRKHDVTKWRQSHKLPANNYDDMVTDAHNIELSNLKEKKPARVDSESLFYDTKFLENYLGKEIK